MVVIALAGPKSRSGSPSGSTCLSLPTTRSLSIIARHAAAVITRNQLVTPSRSATDPANW